MATKVSWFQRILDGVRAFLDESAFHLHGEPSRPRKFVHFWMLVIKSFVRNRCLIRAAALSYTTLLALIPMLALAMSVTTSMLKKEGKDQIEQFINKFVSTMVPPAVVTNTPVEDTIPVDIAGTNNAPAQTGALVSGASSNAPSAAIMHPDVVSAQKRAAEEIYKFVQKAQSGALTGIGALALILVAISMVRSIEATLNDIWGVTRGRGWGLSIALYWTTVTLGPVVLAFAVGLMGGPHLKGTRDFLARYEILGFFVFKVLPVTLLWLTFTLFYKAVPNTKVQFVPALVGGIVGGTVWHFNNVFGFLYVSRVVSNSNIYGGLALVPVLMAGIYFSWVIFLFGAQVAYAFQNRKLYFQEKLAENVNQRGREFVALRLMTCLGQRFHRGLPPPTVQAMSDELGVPSRLVQQVLQTLLAAHLVMEVSGAEPAYAPARPLENITAHHVLMAMRATVGQELVTRDEPVRQEVYGEFARIQEAERQVASAVTVLALVNRAETRIELAPPSAEQDLKLSPALVPSSKPAVQSEQFEARPSPPASEARTPPAEWTDATVATETAPSPQSKTPKSSVVPPTTEEERDFPL